MPPVPHPGTTEIAWLADLKEPAERVGSSVFGEQVRWSVENTAAGTDSRPDVIVRRDNGGEVLASGEAKRPDVPAGAHALVASEIRDALAKGSALGAPVCFTTNFFDCAVFDAKQGVFGSDLDRLQGGLIPLVPTALANSASWWAHLPHGTRSQVVEVGLRHLFERLRTASSRPVARDINRSRPLRLLHNDAATG